MNINEKLKKLKHSMRLLSYKIGQGLKHEVLYTNTLEVLEHIAEIEKEIMVFSIDIGEIKQQ